jgi:hypothetical protein
MTIYVLPLPFPTPPLSLNDRMHWAQKARAAKGIRSTTHFLAMLERLPLDCRHATVTLTYHPATTRNRDTDNMFATLKPCIDGLVDYGLIPDDHSGYVTSACRIGETRKPSQLTLTIEVTE